MKRMIFSVLLLLCAISFCACSSKKESGFSIVGEWSHDTYLINGEVVDLDTLGDYCASIYGEDNRNLIPRKYGDLEFVFFDDGTFMVRSNGDLEEGGKYSIAGTILKLSDGSDNYVLLTIEGGKIILEDVEGMCVRYKKDK